MPLGNVEDLRSFVAIVDQGGLTAAVEALGTSKSTLSRKLTGLEARLGTRLIERTTHSFRLTEAGTKVYQHAKRILDEVEQLKEAMKPGEPSGLLRITTSYALAAEVLGPVLPAFLARYSKIDIDLDASSQLRDLMRDDFDIALRAGPLSGGSLIAKRLGKSELGFFAAPAYLARMGLSVDSISTRPTIGLNRTGRRQINPEKALSQGGRSQCRLSFNDPLLIKKQVLGGFGAAWLPLMACRDEVAAGDLVRCRPGHTLEGAEIFALFHSRKAMPAKTRAFLDFLAEHLMIG